MNTDAPSSFPIARHPRWITLAILVPTLLLSFWFTTQVTRIGDRQEHDRILALAQTVTATLEPEQVAQLHGSPADAGSPALGIVRRELRRVRDVNPDFRFVYLMRPAADHPGQMIFLADAEEASSPDYSAPGDRYDGPSDELFEAWRSAQAQGQCLD